MRVILTGGTGFVGFEVLRQLACGHTVAQVARLVHRSKQTISSHKRSAMAKLHLNDDLALALYLREKYSD